MQARFAFAPGTIEICRAHYATTPAYVPRLGAVISSLDHGCEICSGGEALRQSAYSDDDLRALRTEAGAAGDAEQVALCDLALAGDATAYMTCARALDAARAMADAA